MAVVRALAGLRYDPARVGDLSHVIAPPYDVISPAQQEALYALSPHNVIRFVLPQDADRATAALRALREWMRARILVADPTPALYLYSQTFTLPDGRPCRRDGILCRLRLEDLASGVVRRHERTLPGPKADRLAILRAAGANASPIFGLYSRPGERLRDLVGAAASGPPLVDARDGAGGGHQLWRLAEAAAIARVEAALAPETIVIADGHHRYETALTYRDERRGAEAARWVLAVLANMEEEGVVILPTHRLVPGPLRVAGAALVERLAQWFEVVPLADGAARPPGEIDLVLPGERLRLRPRPAAAARLTDVPAVLRDLDVAVLHGVILEPLLGLTAADLEFTHDDAEAVAAVEAGRVAAAFLLSPPAMSTVRASCLAGEVMPEKSTYFYPKVASGLLFHLVGPPWV